MSVRQYIGARYVPKFFEGNNGAEWESGVAYEPLTIVTYLSNSYTSKKTVPATIGTPNANPDYWVSTGIYSDQIEQYRREVEDVKNGYLNNKKIAILGDSNATRFTTYDHWSEFSNVTIDNVSQNGAQWSSMINQIQNISGIPDIMLLICGSNDIQSAETGGLGIKLGKPDVKNHEYVNDNTTFDNMKKFLTLVRQQYPKCEIICLTRPTHPTIDIEKWNYYTFFEKEIMNEFSVPVIDLQMLYNVCEFITAQSNWAKADTLHFSDEAYQRIEGHISYILKNAWLYNVSLEEPTDYYTNLTNDTNTVNDWVKTAWWVARYCYTRAEGKATSFAKDCITHFKGGQTSNDVPRRATIIAANSVANLHVRGLFYDQSGVWYCTAQGGDTENLTYVKLGECRLEYRETEQNNFEFNVSDYDSGVIYIRTPNYDNVNNAPPQSGGYSITINRMSNLGLGYATYFAVQVNGSNCFIGRDTGKGTAITWYKITTTAV